MALRHLANEAIERIRKDPEARAPRFAAPADSHHAGSIVDLSVPGLAIFYQLREGGRVVEVIDIYRVAL